MNPRAARAGWMAARGLWLDGCNHRGGVPILRPRL